jgi:hypothetical protein
MMSVVVYSVVRMLELLILLLLEFGGHVFAEVGTVLNFSAPFLFATKFV